MWMILSDIKAEMDIGHFFFKQLDLYIGLQTQPDPSYQHMVSPNPTRPQTS